MRSMAAAFWLIGCLFIAGCVNRVDPEMLELTLSDGALAPLPQISLVRHTVPETSTMTLNIYGSDSRVEEVSKSRFGDPDEEADLSCVITGMRDSLPDAHIVPTSAFWEKVVAPDEVVELSELFVAPALTRWQALDLDVLVIAYHKIVDVETFFMEAFVEGGYWDEDRETAALVVIGLQNQKVIPASKVIFEDDDFVGHVFIVIPFGGATVATSDPCNMVGEAAGAAIANAQLKSAPRVVVVAAGNDPYDSAQTVIREEEREKEERESGPAMLEACKQPFSEVIQLDTATLYKRALSCRRFGTLIRWNWECLAAHQGDSDSQNWIAGYYRYGLDPIQLNLVAAYKWYSLAAKDGDATTISLRDVFSRQLTPDQIAEAERLVAEWEPNPAECEIETADTTN